MFNKTYKSIKFLGILSLFLGISILIASATFAAEKTDAKPLAVKSTAAVANISAAGFYQFNNLEISKNSTADEPPSSIEAIQKNEKKNRKEN